VIGILGVVAQMAIVAHAPDAVYACDAVDVTVAISAPGSSMPRLSPPSFQPFDVLRATEPRVQYSRARSMITSEYRFTLTTDRSGQFVIPAFSAALGDQRVQSRPLTVTVFPRRGRPAPTVVARARIDTGARLDLRSAASADSVYVGQQATYEVAVFLNSTARDRLRRNPTFYPPEMQSMLAYDLPAPDRAQRIRTGSQCFDALVYRRALFPLVPGRLVIPPAQLVYTTGISASSLWSREESHELQTDSVTIVAVEPPTDGRPADFSGAVGDLNVEARMDSTVGGRVGDPMLLTLRVTGWGNVKLFPRPVLRLPWAGLVAADERVSVDSGNARIGGQKEFDWVLTPRVAGEFDLPPVRYDYFDPWRHSYEVAISPPSRVRVNAGSLAHADTASAEPVLTIRTSYGGPAWPAPQSHPLFWLALALAPMPALVTRARRHRAHAGPAVVTPHEHLEVLVSSTARDAVLLRRQFVRALAQRLGCNAEDFTHPGALERALRRSGVSVDTAARAEGLLRDLDAAAYAGTGEFPVQATRDARAVARAVDAEALSRRELPFWLPGLVVAVLLGTAATAIASDMARSHFMRGVSAYLRQDFVASVDAFADAVADEPMAADAWANYGTASWTIADTAAAVLGWRQALALDPGASEVHQRLDAVRAAGITAPGWVPQLPRHATVWVFAALWLAAWLVAWVAPRAHEWSLPGLGRAALPLGVCALLIGLVAIETETRVAGQRLAVVRGTGALTSDPAIGMDRGPNVGIGEIVRAVGRRGSWTRVEATDDRQGWIPSTQLLPLSDRRPAPRDVGRQPASQR
jgi:hypothetical protein